MQAKIPSDEPFNIGHGNWSFPGLAKTDLIDDAQDLIDLIDQYGSDDLGSCEPTLNDYHRRLQYLQTQTIPNIWPSPAAAVPAYTITLNGLRRALATLKPLDNRRKC